MQANPHGSLGESQNLCHFFSRQLFHVAQDDDCLVGFWKTIDRIMQESMRFVAFDESFRVPVGIGVRMPPTRSKCRLQPVDIVFLEGIEARGFPERRPGEVDRDGTEPGRYLRVPTKSLKFADGL